jgi:hypothetical protein
MPPPLSCRLQWADPSRTLKHELRDVGGCDLLAIDRVIPLVRWDNVYLVLCKGRHFPYELNRRRDSLSAITLSLLHALIIQHI